MTSLVPHDRAACLPVFVNETRQDGRMGHRTGRPSKGRRDAILAKPPVAFGTILKSNAEALDLSYGDYLVKLAAEALDLPEFAPAPPRDRNNELDLPLQEATARAA